MPRSKTGLKRPPINLMRIEEAVRDVLKLKLKPYDAVRVI